MRVMLAKLLLLICFFGIAWLTAYLVNLVYPLPGRLFSVLAGAFFGSLCYLMLKNGGKFKEADK